MMTTCDSLRAPYTLNFLHSCNCALRTEERTLQSETVLFSLHKCTKSSMNFTEFTMNVGYFTVAENCIMTSTEEVICYVAIATVVGRKK
jgi:hypothetical protein